MLKLIVLISKILKGLQNTYFTTCIINQYFNIYSLSYFKHIHAIKIIPSNSVSPHDNDIRIFSRKILFYTETV